jgi:hypothetical protein
MDKQVQDPGCWRVLQALENVPLDPMDRHEVLDLVNEVEQLRALVLSYEQDKTDHEEKVKELEEEVEEGNKMIIMLQELSDNVDTMDNAIMELDGRSKKGPVWELYKVYLDERISNDAKSGRLD